MTVAEEKVLGAVILDPNQYRFVSEIISGEDFSTQQMGVVFDKIGEMIFTGQHVDTITVVNSWSDWNLRGLDSSVVFSWANAEVSTYSATEYASVVRKDSVRRALLSVGQKILGDINDTSVSPIDKVTEAVNSLNEIRSGSSTSEIRAKKLKDILDGEDTYDWLIPGLLERRDRLIVTGPEGFGKTTFIRQISILAAAGINPITFNRIDPVRVLVVDAENTEMQWRRAVRSISETAARLGLADPREVIHIAAGKRIDITKGSHLAEIHKLVDTHNPDMLMIGPLYKLVSKAINSDDDAAPLIVALDSLRDRGLSLIMEAHAGKSANADGERDLRPRGSAALLGWPEFGFGLRPVPGDSDSVVLSRWRGDRDQRDWPKKMRKGGVWPWTPEEIYEFPSLGF